MCINLPISRLEINVLIKYRHLFTGNCLSKANVEKFQRIQDWYIASSINKPRKVAVILEIVHWMPVGQNILAGNSHVGSSIYLNTCKCRLKTSVTQ